MSKSILVTGATGFIGSYLSKRLVGEGHSVVGLSLRGRTERIVSLLEDKRFRLVQGDIRDPQVLDDLLKEDHIESIFHLAAKLPNAHDDRNDMEYIDTNLKGTFNLLNAASSHKIRRLVYSSSMAVYSMPPKRLPVKERDQLMPANLYGISKMAGESCCHLYCAEMGLTVLRLGGAYGFSERRTTASSRFIHQALANRPITVWGDGLQTTDYIYVEDIVDACLSALDRNLTGIYNVGSGQQTSIVELARQIVRLTNSKSEIVLTGRPSDRPFRFSLDVNEVKKRLNFAPRPLEQGLREYIAKITEGSQE